MISGLKLHYQIFSLFKGKQSMITITKIKVTLTDALIKMCPMQIPRKINNIHIKKFHQLNDGNLSI